MQLLFKYPQIDSPFELIKNAYKIRSFFEFPQYQGNNMNNNKEIKIELNNKNKNIKINQMTKKEKEKYDFDKKDINQNINNINNINNKKQKKQFINTEFQINYNNISNININEGITLQKMALIQKLKNIEKKYENLLQIEDDSDLKFIINELYSKFQLK